MKQDNVNLFKISFDGVSVLRHRRLVGYPLMKSRKIVFRHIIIDADGMIEKKRNVLD